MADEQYKWLDRETAERLLRGESLEVVDASARDQAERLSEALGALSAEAARATGELPGEKAALAAFREARGAAGAERGAASAADGDSGRRSAVSAHHTDAGLVRIGALARTGIPARRPRWARPVRLAFAAVVAAGTLGGVAMAAGGVLPTPFGGEHSEPVPSVTAGTSGEPLASASPQTTSGAGAGSGQPSGSTGVVPGGSSAEAVAPDDSSGASADTSHDLPSATRGSGWSDAAASCRDIRDGKGLNAGRRRALENLAGGSARVNAYCKVVLAPGDSASGTPNSGKGGANDGGEGAAGHGEGTGNGQGRGKGDQDDDESHPGKGKGTGKGARSGGGNGRGRHRGVAAPAPTAFIATLPGHQGRTAPVPMPGPAHTAF
ncbi:hypothetical protein LK07_21675 [Streptomyces pluripotens]|uniref:Extensin n=1 Tax=Streptomyces pluripotens TaxID=1355015 RepID=A0A221P2A1_9ACTN|nr:MULTISPECIES: hypothetical protein [Streptomyces]ARP71940.1 hypothetical protein LK06_020520 [Streptomyces pluripotens]ASN26188.1 hypothetical protein LK07_21675 [Streptomyces pluripotens]MCH0556435.1 hypothetical protein [Streptomyces sp. MUM 16J]